MTLKPEESQSGPGQGMPGKISGGSKKENELIFKTCNRNNTELESKKMHL